MSSLFPCLVIAFIVGLVAGSWFFIPYWVAGTFCIALIALAVLFRKRKSPLPYVLLLCLFASLGALHSQRIIPRLIPADHVFHRVTPDPVDLAGVIVRPPEIREDRTRIVIEALRVYNRLKYQSAQGLVMITVGREGDRFRYGDRIRLKCRLRKPMPQGNPGEFDWRRYLALRGILVQGFVGDGREILLVRHHQAGCLKGKVERIRRKLATFIRNEFSTPAREILLALVVGERWAVPALWRESFAALGVSHLLAISGLHLGLIALITYGAAKWLLLRSSWLTLRFPIEKVSWILIVPVLVGYSLIAGMATSTQRALVMILTLAMCFLLDRVRNLYHALALAALIILLIRPAAIYDLSFQLSFLAVLGIVYAVSRWSEVLFRPDPLVRLEPRKGTDKIRRSLILLGLTSTAALLATLPISLLHFHRAPIAALPANIVLVPLVGFFILPLALAGSALFLLWPTAGHGLLWICGGLVQGVAQVIHWGARLTGGGLHLPTPKPWEVAIFYGVCVGLCNLHRSRWVRWYTLGMIAALLGLWMGEWGFRQLDRDLRVHCLSVGNGLSILVEGPGSNIMLVDGGGTYDNRVDIGALHVAPMLWHRRVTSLDRVILSHPHPDHANGLRFILKRFRVRRVWDNGDHRPTVAYETFREAARAEHVSPQPMYRGMAWQMGEALVRVLHPPQGQNRWPGKNQGSRTNNASAVLHVSLGNVSFLLPGDIEAETEAWLAAQGGLRSTVLIAPHHGSRTSSTPVFLDAVCPAHVVFSSRWGRWSLVHPEVLRRYQDRGVEVYHTGEDGMVSFETDGDMLTVGTFLSQKKVQIQVPHPQRGVECR